jgi:chromosome segregation protein
MTRLLALELFGFKSFADRTRFEFPDGITVVVGPNGSGKSNVVDAIKWVLGEQSVRSLRGKEMTDVIFAGSAARKPLNYAEVALVFDNSSGDLPVATPEVQIMRRVTRDGDSEYLVNGETARLRDIRELFSGTGAATQAYSVIEQGRVDALLVASGRERRAVFEEAAGITRFRTRRAEALRRLDRAEQNRQRLADIVGEVSSRLETVKHQAARARRWRQMTDRLRMLRLAAADRDLAAVDAAVAEVDLHLQRTRADYGELEARAGAAATEATALAGTAGQLQPFAVTARTSVAAAAQRAAAADAALAIARSRRDDLERALARAEADVHAAATAERTAARAAVEATKCSADISAQLVSIDARLAACEHAADGSHHDAAAGRRRLAAAAAGLDQVRQRRVRLEAARERAEERATDAGRRAAAAHDARTAAEAHQARLAETEAACAGGITTLSARLAAAQGELETLEVAHRDRTTAVQAAWQDLARWQARLEACRERMTVLDEVVSRQEGLSAAARRLLAADQGQPPGLAGIVADLIVASIDHAGAVDTALGDLGQALVVESLADVVAWHDGWAGSAAGRDVVAAGGRIPLVATAALRPPPDFDPGPAAGVVGRLDRLLVDPPSGERERLLRESLLGRVWLVETVRDALPLAAAAPPATLFVARDGSCVSADGLFEFGAPAAATGLVARRSELRALETRHRELETACTAARERITGLQAEADDAQAAIRQAQGRRQTIAEMLTRAQADREQTAREQRAAALAVDGAARELLAAEQASVEATALARTAAAAVADVEPDLTAALGELEAAEAAIDDLERSRGEVLDEIQRLRIEQATCREKLAQGEDTRSALAGTLAGRRRAAAESRDAANAARATLSAHDLELLLAGAARAEAVAALERAETALAGVEGEVATVEARRRELAALLDTCRDSLARLAEQVHARELEAGEARHRRERIVERIRDEYDIDISAGVPNEPLPADAAPIPGDRDALERDIEELRRKLASMTTVNLEALVEAEELATRLATLEAQLADVTDGKASIEQLIARIDDESRRLLGETIETVRGHFRELFERLFGGGQADIVLEEGVDLLETAVEIMARPPGKEPRSISLLSGGEKTMTCVALLLAIFKSRPSPFCVLDEVDAALDESNIDRYVAVLRDFLSATQFIVVTHSKKTMAAATTLYGVTQEESGVSKRISVRFESTAAAVESRSRAA